MSLFRRKIEVIIGQSIKITNVMNENEELFIEFSIVLEDAEEPNRATLKIYNLSNDTINRIKRNDTVIINAGYEGDVGTIFAGGIILKEVLYNKTEKVLTLEIQDALSNWLDKKISKTYVAGTKASEIIRDLTNQIGIEIGLIELENDIVYERGRTLNTTLRNALKDIVKDTGSKLYSNKNKLYITKRTTGINIAVVLNSETGLIDSPTPFTELGEFVGDTDFSGFNVETLLNHRIGINTILQIQSKTANGFYRVLKCRHLADNTDFKSILEVAN